MGNNEPGKHKLIRKAEFFGVVSALLLFIVLVSISVFMAFLTVFHFINSRDNSPLSHSVLPVLSLPY